MLTRCLSDFFSKKKALVGSCVLFPVKFPEACRLPVKVLVSLENTCVMDFPGQKPSLCRVMTYKSLSFSIYFAFEQKQAAQRQRAWQDCEVNRAGVSTEKIGNT